MFGTLNLELPGGARLRRALISPPFPIPHSHSAFRVPRSAFIKGPTDSSSRAPACSSHACKSASCSRPCARVIPVRCGCPQRQFWIGDEQLRHGPRCGVWTLRSQWRGRGRRRRRFTTTMNTFARASPIPQSRSFFLCAFAALREFFFSSRQDAKTLRSDNQRGVSERALSLWTSRPMKWIRLLMGVGFLSGSAMALRCSVLFELVDRPGAPHTRTLVQPTLTIEIKHPLTFIAEP
jgi:hypothetical protein